MDCERARQEILESFEEHSAAAVQQALDEHLAACPACAAFAATQRAVDARLTALLVPPEMSPAFRATLQQRIRKEPARAEWDALPDLVHVSGSVLATWLCALLVPSSAALVIGAGAASALLTYVLVTIVRSSFEDLEQPDW